MNYCFSIWFKYYERKHRQIELTGKVLRLRRKYLLLMWIKHSKIHYNQRLLFTRVYTLFQHEIMKYNCYRKRLAFHAWYVKLMSGTDFSVMKTVTKRHYFKYN